MATVPRLVKAMQMYEAANGKPPSWDVVLSWLKKFGWDWAKQPTEEIEQKDLWKEAET